MDDIFRSVETEIESVLEGERSIVSRINTGGIDRFDTIIDPLGCDVSHFNRLQSVLWDHGQDPVRGHLPIGKGWAKVRRSEGDMIAKTVFDTDEFSDLLFQKCKAGSIRGWSIHAKPQEVSAPTKQEIAKRPELERCKWICRKWDLLEYSLTPTAGNSDCVTMLISRGMIARPAWYVERTATDSEGGMSGGGAAVKPTVVGEDKGVSRSHVEGEMCPDGTCERCDAMRSTPDPKRSVPFIDTDGASWWIDQGGKRIMSFGEAGLAQDALRFMLHGKPMDVSKLIRSCVEEVRREGADIQEMTRQYIALYTTGRI